MIDALRIVIRDLLKFQCPVTQHVEGLQILGIIIGIGLHSLPLLHEFRDFFRMLTILLPCLLYPRQKRCCRRILLTDGLIFRPVLLIGLIIFDKILLILLHIRRILRPDQFQYIHLYLAACNPFLADMPDRLQFYRIQPVQTFICHSQVMIPGGANDDHRNESNQGQNCNFVHHFDIIHPSHSPRLQKY